MSVVFDISRLISRSQFETPTGIDRFELNYANWALERFYPRIHFVARGPFGHRAVSSKFARSLIGEASRKWNSNAQAGVLERLVDQINHGAVDRRRSVTPSANSDSRFWQRKAQFLDSIAALFWDPDSIAASSLFVHVSHSAIHHHAGYNWLARTRCSPLFYVHDLIPLLRPEFCRSGESDRHKTRIQTILRLHRLILCNSESTARTLDEIAASHGLAQPFTAVLPPGLEEPFASFEVSSAIQPRQPYFVCLGTIEPRKNHALLLELWRQLVARYGTGAPRLVIAGRRGWDNSHVFSVLDDTSPFRGSVIEVSGLNDHSIAQLLGGAAALLAPSHIEGYGMPLAEALALGTPVIASNIRAHREVSRGRAMLLDPLDGLGWLAAIDAHAKWPRRLERTYRHWSWAAHFDALQRLLVSARISAPAAREFAREISSAPHIAGAEPCQAI